jgi:hypothetical protein
MKMSSVCGKRRREDGDICSGVKKERGMKNVLWSRKKGNERDAPYV